MPSKPLLAEFHNLPASEWIALTTEYAQRRFVTPENRAEAVMQLTWQIAAKDDAAKAELHCALLAGLSKGGTKDIAAFLKVLGANHRGVLEAALLMAQAEEIGEITPDSMADVEAETVRWLWHGWIPFGKLSLISGDPGNFKSGLTVDIAARLTTGRPMPFCELADPPANVLMLFSEDGAGDTVKPRLEAAGADMSRVDFLTPRKLPEFNFMVMERMLEARPYRLMIIDPLFGFVPEGAEGKSSTTLRKLFLNPLTDMAEQHRMAIVALVHLNKMETGQNSIYRSTGRLDYLAAARSAILIGKEPQDNPEAVPTFIMASNKMNLCRPPQSLRYRIESERHDTSPYVVWEGIAEEYTAQNMLAMTKPDKDASRHDEAKDFLQEFLSDGKQPQTEVEAAASERNISSRTLRRAKDDIARSEKYGNRWYWSLRTSPAQGVQGVQEIHSREDGQIDGLDGQLDQASQGQHSTLPEQVDHILTQDDPVPYSENLGHLGHLGQEGDGTASLSREQEPMQSKRSSRKPSLPDVFTQLTPPWETDNDDWK